MAGPSLLFKILPVDLWHEADGKGHFTGSAVDRADGFIHLSDGTQVRETAARHFRGQGDLVLVAVDAKALGPGLKWEPSRGGALFPHLYDSLPVSAAVWVKPLPLGADGAHIFPELDT